jgi:hypothetical protein
VGEEVAWAGGPAGRREGREGARAMGQLRALLAIFYCTVVALLRMMGRSQNKPYIKNR